MSSGGPQALHREHKHQEGKSAEHLGSCYVWNLSKRQGPPVPDRPPAVTGFPSPLGVSSAQCQSVAQAECTQGNTTLGGSGPQLPALDQLGAVWRGAVLFKFRLVPEILSQAEVAAGSPPPSLCSLPQPSVPYSTHLDPHLALATP